ncbi:MAG: hypothetical protein WC044_09870 [Crocinitomicaceae bacterium]
MNKVAITAVLAATLFSANAFAQESTGKKIDMENNEMSENAKKTPEERAKEQTEKLDRLVKLDESQKTAVLQTNTNYNMRLDAIRNNASMTDEDKKSNAALMEGMRKTDIRATLNADQLVILDASKQNAKGHGEMKENQKEVKHEVEPAELPSSPSETTKVKEKKVKKNKKK